MKTPFVRADAYLMRRRTVEQGAGSGPDKGLTDKSAEAGEREALGHLFAGAIGTYKNPRSHRRVNLADPGEAIEILMPSNLLRIIERAKNTEEA